MRQALENKLSMYATVVLVLNAHAAIVATRPALAAVQAAFEAIILAIRDADQKQRTPITGVTQDKAELRNAAIIKTLVVAAGVRAWAAFNEDQTVVRQMSVTESELIKLSDELLPQAMYVVHDAANLHIASLADYGIFPATVSDLKAAIDDYKDYVERPRQAIGDRKAQTDLLPQLFRQGDTLLKMQMDPLVGTFSVDEPVFVAEYTNSREIIDFGRRHTTLRGKVTDSNGDPIYNATVEIATLGRTAQSGLDGVYQIEEFMPGIYDVRAVADGYVGETRAHVEFTRGEITEVNFVLAAI